MEVRFVLILLSRVALGALNQVRPNGQVDQLQFGPEAWLFDPGTNALVFRQYRPAAGSSIIVRYVPAG